MKIIRKFSLTILVFSAFLLPNNVLAFDVVNLPDTLVKDDFIVSPAKTEIVMSPGDKIVKYITILNRFGVDYNFSVTAEDFSPDKESGNPVLNGGVVLDRFFSLKNYIKPDADSFFLRQGSRATVAITISVPKNAPPGGRYAAVLIGASPRQKTDSQTTIISRIGSLFLVRVNGVAEENGHLTNFIFKDGKFWISYRNDGNIHLNSYGVVEIEDDMGNLLEIVQIDPWTILPGSTRSRALSLSGDIPNGKYTATIKLNRGYEDIIDIKEIAFRLGPILITDKIPEIKVDLSFEYYVIIIFIGVLILLGVRFIRKK